MPHAMPANPARSVARRREPAVPSPVLGTIIFIFTEVMFFAGLYSAHTIAESSAPLGWPPPDQPRLPWEETAVNTVALLLSGVLVAVAGRVHSSAALARRDRREVRGTRAALPPLALGMFLGAFFVFAQGVEWVALVREGLTLTSSTHGAFFYLIVGAHALHAVAALAALGWALAALARGRLGTTAFQAVRLFWFFVVGVWPALYLKVYW